MLIYRLLIICALLQFSSLYSQESYRTIRANQGDGIYSILRNNGLEPGKNYQKFLELNKKKLKGSVNLIKGESYLIPILSNDFEKKETLETDKNIDSAKSKEVIIAEINPQKSDQSKLDSVVIEPINVDSVQKVFPKEKKTETVKTIENPIFGSGYNSIVVKTDRLKGAVYYLISGHGGPDPGAISKYKGNRISEDEYAYDITLRLARELISHEALVYIIVLDLNDGIRDKKVLKLDKDELNYPDKEIPASQVARLKQRVEIVNKLYEKHKGQYQRLIVTHIDSRTKGQDIDVFFYHHDKSQNGKRFAENIYKTFKSKYLEHQPNRKYDGTFTSRKLYLVNNTLPAMAYIEIGNIQNKKDQKRILDPDNRQALAEWISEGALLDMKEEKDR